jgi:hypothetical protein
VVLQHDFSLLLCFFLQAKPKLGDGPFSVEGIQKMLDDWEKDHLTREEMVLMLAKPEVLHVVDYASGTVGMDLNEAEIRQEMNGLETENFDQFDWDKMYKEGNSSTKEGENIESNEDGEEKAAEMDDEATG